MKKNILTSYVICLYLWDMAIDAVKNSIDFIWYAPANWHVKEFKIRCLLIITTTIVCKSIYLHASYTVVKIIQDPLISQVQVPTIIAICTFIFGTVSSIIIFTTYKKRIHRDKTILHLLPAIPDYQYQYTNYSFVRYA